MAYWQFEDGVDFGKGGFSQPHLTARDSSRNGNHLPLVNPPKAADIIIRAKVSLQALWAHRRVTMPELLLSPSNLGVAECDQRSLKLVLVPPVMR